MTEADATPNGKWNVAITGTVIEKPEPLGIPPIDYPGIPIIHFLHTPATITLHRSEYPHGAIIVNENPRPTDTTPIHTETRPSLNVEISHALTKEVIIPENIGWPTGKIVLFKD